ncbi:MAG: hypothetical protein HQL75_18035 [Magnetococcales bacterium]|nr:hypothetical protein [Magnetococcales bacterium]
MPVNLLLCEGGSGSPDVRIIGKLLAGLCQVTPEGGKYGMGSKIMAKRYVQGNVVAGILDGDFLKDWENPTGKPRVWQSGNGLHFGWCWERKEIENYLLEPGIVAKSLGDQAPDKDLYLQALEAARDRIADYQAARTALSANRKRFKNLPSSFGPERGKEKHPFPDALDERHCREGIHAAVANHQEDQRIQASDVINAYERFLPECRPQGVRYQHFRYAFAGKDLFLAMDDWFKEHGFQGAWAFREKVLIGIQRTTEDISTWEPEWDQLRKQIQSGI